MRATTIVTLARLPSPEDLAALDGRADYLEVRADLTPSLEAAELRSSFRGGLLYTLRSRAEGGESGHSRAERAKSLAAAAAEFDMVDLEADRDLEPELLGKIPAEKRVISWHGAAREPEELREIFGAMSGAPARLYKMVPLADGVREALAPLALLKSLGRRDLVAFAAGEVGFWTRLLAPRLGAPVVYAGASEPGAAPGQPALARLEGDYGLPELPAVDELYGVVGSPALRSLSPRLHNAAYREQGAAALYLPFEVPVFGDFWIDLVESGSLAFLGFRLVGLSVTAPFKEIAQAVAGVSSPLAERIGSANTLVRRNGVWAAETTDPQGVLGPLEERGFEPRGRAAAVLGVGGAGRAAAFALARAGASVTLFNRGVERGRRVAAELELPFESLERLRAEAFELLVNATPLGGQGSGPLPFDPRRLAAGTLTVDLSYRRDEPTALVSSCRAAGHEAVDGREVLLHQALRQYLIMTGRELPMEVGRRALGLERRR